ncbi:hypothetical protein Vadar_000863 [Vaccinium darrowii]|uniref:Uncharacterized protein n=1 Tax=Vaccinium darrowii TaxID=229202 RepID=A0ACB7YAU9_9ERIC|nr:hypothetical protein Vadar_000863 [Vaccinium darrowii]
MAPPPSMMHTSLDSSAGNLNRSTACKRGFKGGALQLRVLDPSHSRGTWQDQGRSQLVKDFHNLRLSFGELSVHNIVFVGQRLCLVGVSVDASDDARVTTSFQSIVDVLRWLYMDHGMPDEFEALVLLLDGDWHEAEPLFEVFNPQGGNEGEGEWTSLPRPPFYPRSSDAGGKEKHCAGRIISHAVVGLLICFFTSNKDYGTQEIEALYAFDVLSCHLEHLNDYKTGCERDVEGLESCSLCKPSLVYGIFHHLLDTENGWFCLLQFGTDNEDLLKGKEHISATVFWLVKKHKDKVSLGRSSHWRLGRTLSPPLDAPRDVSKAVGEIQVFGAEELCSSLFAPGVESFNTFYAAVGFFTMKKVCTPSYYPVDLGEQNAINLVVLDQVVLGCLLDSVCVDLDKTRH